jgi:tetrahydromethanopterin S-methyltransferase subunit B
MGNINGAVASIQTTLNGIISSITSADNNLGTYLSYFNSPGQYGSMGMQVFYGVLIGFSCLALLGALLTVCCDKYGCRYLMYFSCLILFIGALVGFVVSTLFSILVPAFTWTCSYLDNTLQSSANFQTNLGTLFGTTTVNQIAVCMPFGDGNIVNSVGGGATAGLNNLTSVISGLGSFSASNYTTTLTSSLTSVFDLISAYTKGQITDLSQTNDFSALTTISNPANYPLCTDSNFLADSWVPSINQWTNYSSIPCKATNGNTGTPTPCGNVITTVSASCSGCMDTTLLMTLYNTAGNLGTALSTRYPTGTCTAFINDMENVWTNYYSIKNTALAPTDADPPNTGLLGRALHVKNQIFDNATSAGVFYSLYQIQTVFSNIVTNLNAINSLTDPNYGLLAGLNCKVFG